MKPNQIRIEIFDQNSLYILGYLLLLSIFIVICILIYKKYFKTTWGKVSERNENHAIVQQKILDLLESGKVNPQECAELLGAVSETKEEHGDNQQETQTPEH